MKITIKRITTEDLLVYMALGLYSFFALIQTTLAFQYVPTVLYKSAYLFSVVLLAIRELSISKYSLKTLVLLIVFAFFTINSSNVVETIGPVPIGMILIYLLRTYSFRNIAKFALLFSSVFLVTIIVSSKLGLITDYVSIYRNRHYLGFQYSLFSSRIFLNILLLYIYVYEKRLKFFTLCFLAIANQWLYWQTDSRLSYLSGLLLIGYALLKMRFPQILEKSTTFLRFLTPSYLYCMILSLLAVRFYNPGINFWFLINDFLGQRLYLAKVSLERYGFNLLGQRVPWQGFGLDARGNYVTTEYLYVDNLYINLLQRYGVIFIIVFILLFTVLMVKLFRRRQYTLVFILAILSAHALIEDLVFYIHYNSFMYLLGFVFERRHTVFDREEI